MSSCYYVARQLTNYLDGDLTEAQKHNIEQHLQSCSTCREKYEQVKHLTRTLPQLPRYKTSPHFEMILRSRIRSESLNDNLFSRFSRMSLLIQVPAYASFAVTFLIIGFLLGQSIANRNSVHTNMAMDTPTIHITQRTAAQEVENGEQAPPTKMRNYVIEVVHPEEIIQERESAELSSTGLHSLNGNKESDSLSSSYTRPSISGYIQQANATINF